MKTHTELLLHAARIANSTGLSRSIAILHAYLVEKDFTQADRAKAVEVSEQGDNWERICATAREMDAADARSTMRRVGEVLR